MIFKYSQYRNFLDYVQRRSPVFRFQDWKGENGVLLRHDVDVDVKAAYDLALIEESCGVRSTFYFLATATAYNLAAESNRKMLRDMVARGFEIGLHFDPTLYTVDALDSMVDEEARWLATITGAAVRSVSLHNPSVHGQYPLFAKYLNAYDPSVFSPERYISDSRMIFRADIFEFVERAVRMPVQVLLHPLHFTENGSTYPEIMARIARDDIDRLHQTISLNSTYRSLMETDLFSYIVERRR